ncbi:MAG: hypothetical protein NUV77_00610, partial [Thermoguttaceae bacterium]|nr:hypothetical protein [Thermoguttaceae bacterium]
MTGEHDCQGKWRREHGAAPTAGMFGRPVSRREALGHGLAGAAAMLLAAQALGAQRAEVLRYGDSAEAHPMDT